MATIIDTLVTEFKLKADQFTRGVASVKQDMASLKGAYSTMSTVGHSVATSLDGAIGPALGFAAAATAVAGAAGAVGFSFMNQAAAFDTFERTFSAALGSMEKGKRMMEYLQNYAGKSAFSLESLAGAAKSLAAGGIEVERFLPVLERISLVASGTDPSGLQEIAGALLRAKGGGFGEAMENFRRAGISTGDFQKQGINIDKGGQVHATPEQFLAALIKISEGRPKQIADAVSGGDATKLSNAFDAAGKASVSLGQELNTAFLPAIEAATNEVNTFTDSGGFKMIADEIIGLSDALVGSGGVESSLVEFGANLARIPAIIDTIQSGAEEMVDLFMRANPLAQLKNGIMGVADFLTGGKASEAMGQAAGDLVGKAGKFFNDAYGGRAHDDFIAQYEANKKVREKKKKGDGGATGDGSPVADPLPPIVGFLAGIERNTADTARNTRKNDLENLVEGGGELARRGLDKTQLAALMRPRSGGSDPELREIQTLLTNMAVVIHRAGQLSAQRVMLDHARAGGR